MKLEAQGRVLDVTQISATDNSEYTLALGRQGDVLGSQLHGKFFTQNVRRNLFRAMTTTAAAIPVANTTAPNFILWNKSTKKNLVLQRYKAGWNATTEAPGNIQICAIQAGYALGTAAPFSAFTAGTPLSGIVGLAANCEAAFGTAGTLTTAGAVIDTTGFSHLTTTGTATFGSFQIIYDFEGEIIVPPTWAIYTVASTATASTYNQSLTWVETPV
jgi:hypothetical protein